MRGLVVLTVLTAAVPPVASAQSYEHGRVRHVEQGVSIQRATETGAEEALANLPFLPGDRVWTDAGGRAEFQFAGGSLLRLDTGSKLDYVSHDDGREERIVLRLWSGALFVHTRDRRDGDFEVETPGGVVVTGDRGAVRIDVQSGEIRLSVYEGEARLEGAEVVTVRAGERVYARRGQIEEGPVPFDRAEGDEFASWDEARREQSTYAHRPVPLPEDVAPYGDELDRHGAWYHETEVGYVWRPYVAAGWQPYSHGRWVWTVFGWTWVPYETWGWAVHHYGRWGHTPALGWYWIPGRTWAPAWVSWAVGGDYVGWCPLGYRDRPLLVYDRFGRGTHGGRGGYAVPRSGATVAQSPWIYLRRGDLAAHDTGRRRVQLDGASARQLRMLDHAQARLTRDVSVGAGPATAAGRAVPRNVATRPTIGDTVPELRADPMTTIPVVRRRRPVEAGEDGGEVRGAPAGAATRFPSRGTPASATAAPAEGAQGARPADVSSGQRRRTEEWGAADRPRREYQGVEARTPERPARERDGASEADREVLRPLFRPLGRRRGEGGEGRGDDGGSVRRRGALEARPSGEPRRRSDGEDAPRAGAGERRRGGDGAVRRGNDGEGRRGGFEGRPREASPRQASPRESGARPEAQAQPRRPPPASAAGRHPRRRSQE